jgi:ectoine hydroxylase-related dioxygenase (phytanoyl-CoA dioxygenase family)
MREDQLPPGDVVAVTCPAGGGVFFSSKILHAAPHNRSHRPRRTLMSIWAGPDVLPTSGERSAYQGIRPRSTQAAYAEQIRKTFPHLFAAATDQARSAAAT